MADRFFDKVADVGSEEEEEDDDIDEETGEVKQRAKRSGNLDDSSEEEDDDDDEEALRKVRTTHVEDAPGSNRLDRQVKASSLTKTKMKTTRPKLHVKQRRRRSDGVSAKKTKASMKRISNSSASAYHSPKSRNPSSSG